MILHDIKQWLLPLLIALWFPLLVSAQEISSLSPSALPFGAYVTGLYHLEADDGSGHYLKEQADGSLTMTALDTTTPGFYFWVVENVYEDTFRIYSAIQKETLLTINTDGSIQWTTVSGSEAEKLLFRMYSAGAARDPSNTTNGVAMGYITTGQLTANYGNTDCKCNFLTVNGNSRFILHDSGIQGENYRPVVFEKADATNALGTVETDTVNHLTRIIQTPPAMGVALPHNFVSSNFFVKGFGEDDFKITVASGTEGYIGFLDYTDHHYTKGVYKNARSKIGVKITNDVISLVHLSGDQLLPSGSLSREVITDFVTGTPFTLGFKGQDSLVVSQNETTYAITRAAPAELFFNQSVSQSGRMLVQLLEGTVEMAYTTRNYLINSEDDLGTDNGNDLVSTHAFFPYNAGNTFVNTFDWQQTQWPVRYIGNAGTVEDQVFSPFYTNSTQFSGISARFDPGGNYVGGEDFSASEGWELIKSDLGYNADGTVRPQAPAHPHIIFYNKASGTLRVLVYTNNEGEANQLKISLSSIGGIPTNQQGYVPKLWGSLQQFSSLDQVQSSTYSKPLAFYSAAGRSWYFADFVMEYDPCIAFFESTLNVQVHKTTQGNLTMVGRFEGGSLPADTPEYNNWQNQREDFLLGVMDNNFGSLENTLGDITFNQYDNFDLLEFEDEVGGSLIGAPIEAWEKEKARIEWQATQTIAEASIAEGSSGILGGIAGAVGGVFEAAGSSVGSGIAGIVEGAASIAGGAAQITAGNAELQLAYANKLYYNAIKDKVKHDDQEIIMNVPPPRPNVTFGELALKGTLTIETTLIPEAFIATPGGFNSDLAPQWYVNGSRGSEPLYNKPLGNFTLIKQPQFGISVVKGGNGTYKAWLKIKEKPYFAHNNTATGKIDDVITIGIHVQTLDDRGKAVSNAAGAKYTNLFDMQSSESLPGAMDITELVDWDQVDLNIAELTDPGIEDIENEINSSIKIAYGVWSLTLTNLKSRDLNRVFANANQYYNGQVSVAYDSSSKSFGYQLISAARALAETEFYNYNFSDDPDFGTTYRFYHTDYDKAGDEFYTLMNNYCTALETVQNPAAKNAENTQNIKGEETAVVEEEPVAEELTTHPGLTVYPNPVQSRLNFRLLSSETGKASIALYDLTGKILISTTDHLDGNSALQGLVNMEALSPGIYILEVRLPGGKSITKKIVKK